MHPTLRRAEILRLVASGKSLNEAGSALGIGQGSARQHLAKACRRLGLPDRVADIHTQAPEYLKRLDTSTSDPLARLQPRIASHLLQALGRKYPNTVSPNDVARKTAAHLLQAGLSDVAVAEIQEWLMQNGCSLRPEHPKTEEHLRIVRRAQRLLDAFGIVETQHI